MSSKKKREIEHKKKMEEKKKVRASKAAVFAQFGEEGRTKGSNRYRRQNRRGSGLVRTRQHPNNCGNSGCIKCWATLNPMLKQAGVPFPKNPSTSLGAQVDAPVPRSQAKMLELTKKGVVLGPTGWPESFGTSKRVR